MPIGNTAYYLAVGDATLADALDFMDGVTYLIHPNGFTFTPGRDDDPLAPLAKGGTSRYARIGLNLKIFAASGDALQAAIRAIDRKLQQARLAQGATPVGTSVCLWQREQGMTQYVYWDVVDGEIGTPQSDGAAFTRTLTLTLTVLPYAHGTAITDAMSGVIVNGLAATIYRAAILGDVPALVELTLADVGTTILNGFRAGARSMPTGAMLAGDWTPQNAWTPANPGTAFADATGINGTTARVMPSAVWQTLAQLVQPAGAVQSGVIDCWPRVRDASVVLGAPGLPTATPSGLTGALTDGVYEYLLTTHDAAGTPNESVPTAAVFATVPLTTTKYLIDAETGDTSLWDGVIVGGTGLNMQASFNADPAASYPLSGSPSQYGFRALAANGAGGGGAFGYKAISGGGNTGVIRADMRINTDTATSATVWTQIPLIVDSLAAHNPLVSLFNIGAGWQFGYNTANLHATAVPLPEIGWLKFEAVIVWNGITGAGNSYTASFYVNNNLVWGPTALALAQAQGAYATALGARASSGAALSVDADNVQLDIVHLGANAGSCALTWPAGTNAAGYYLYWNRNGGAWHQIDVGNVTSYTHSSMSAGTVKNPPSTQPAVVPTSFKLRAALNTVTATPTWYDGPVVQAPSTGGVWVPAYAGAIPLPPAATQDGLGPAAWILQLQVLNTGTTFANFDSDGITFFEHKQFPQVAVPAPAVALAGHRTFVLNTNRYGYSSCQLLTPLVVYDSFNRATNVGVIGALDSGGAYTAIGGGTFGIQNNHFYSNTPGTPSQSFAQFSAGIADYAFSVTLINTSAGRNGIFFRVVDVNNFYAIYCTATGYALYSCVAGVFTLILNNAQAPVVGDQLVVVLSGTLCRLFVNGVRLISRGVTLNTGSVLCGLGSDNAGVEVFDEFTVTAPGTPDWVTSYPQRQEGEIVPVGALYAGPGDTQFTLLPVGPLGVSDVVNIKFTAKLKITPRFRYQRGNT